MSSENDPLAQIKVSFFLECDDLLEALQDGLQAIDCARPDAEAINVIFRAVHSIKGGAGAFDLVQLVGFAHHFETVLDDLRSEKLTLNDDVLKILFRASDCLSDLVRTSRNGRDLENDKVDPISADLAALSSGPEFEDEDIGFFEAMPLGLEVETTRQPNRYTISFSPFIELFTSANEPLFLIRALDDLGDCSVVCVQDRLPLLSDLNSKEFTLSWRITIETDLELQNVLEVFEFVQGLCHLHYLDEESPQASPTTQGSTTPNQPALPNPAAPTAATPPKTTVRVDLDRVDKLVNLVGELVINHAMVSQSIADAGVPANSPVMVGLEEFMQLTRDLQDSVMMIRAQPVKSLFQRMGRIVRESASAVDKDVRLVTDGGTTEMDKTVIERLMDPLTHMIRNSVDHGLESPEERLAAGKPKEGTITLSATHKSGRVHIEIKDDGSGINRQKVQARAIENALIPADADLTESEIDNLLFYPGFSTADKVSQLSGRGVGMDVVKTAIQGLGGRISVTSQAGVGTTFSVSLPLTLAVVDGMIITVSDQIMVIPLSSIEETLILGPKNLRDLTPDTPIIQLRDQFIPLIDLGAIFGLSAPKDSYEDCVALLIGDEDNETVALIVDEILDQRQVVIKGLKNSYSSHSGIAAATILGDGKIALILDPTDIASSTRTTSKPALEKAS